MSKEEFQYGIQEFFCRQQSSSPSLITSKANNEENSTFNSSRDKKLLKNRISAHNSRIKKKQYIQDLQRNERELIRQIESTEKQIQTANQELNNFLTKNRENDSFNHDEKPTYERLKNLIRGQEHFDEDEANMLIELLINRVGVTGKERRRMTDYYSKRLVNFSIPAIYRYLLHASTKNCGLLAEQSKGIYKWDEQFYHKAVLSSEQKAALLRNRQKIADQKRTWIQKIQQFDKIRSGIYKTSYQIEEDLLTVKSLLSTRQMGEIIISLQNRKYNKDLTLGEKDELDKGPCKKIKEI